MVITVIATLLLTGVGVFIYLLLAEPQLFGLEWNDGSLVQKQECKYTGDWVASSECVEGKQTFTRPYEGGESCLFSEIRDCVNETADAGGVSADLETSEKTEVVEIQDTAQMI